MTTGLKRLKDLVQSFKQERPEFAQRAIVSDNITGMSRIVMVRANDLRAVKLP